ncbi:hypothetical protein [Lacihabitans lacunae]|uniref:Molecular chaperone n=1 Tax=Lacihabitans lacunae TaxID=1028214 RepID=A0ABV7Z088_9BACT
MKRVFFLFFFLIGLSEVHAQQVNVNPSIVNFNVGNVGASETKVVTITNNSSKSQSFEVSLGDWNRNPDGSHEYFAPGTKPFSCSSWITLSSNFIEIPAGQKGEILITMQAPTDPAQLEKMKWAMLFVQGAQIKKELVGGQNEAKAAVQEILRMGIHLYQTPPSLFESSARTLNLNPNKENSKVYDFEIENIGKTMITGRAHMEITNLSNSEEVITPVVDFPVFPGGKRVVKLEMPNELKKGKYSILAVLDYGINNPLEAIEKTIEVK